LDIVVGTSAGDWRISAEVTIGPNDISASKQNYSRSDNSHPVAIDSSVIYIEQGQTKVRKTEYVRNSISFNSIDISIIAEHLFQIGVKRIVIMRTPEVLIVALRNDGTLVTLTYGADIGAWTEITSQGHIIDICAYYSTVTNEDVLYVNISYDYVVEGPNFFNLEVMPYPSRGMLPLTSGFFPTPSLTEQGIICLDSWVRVTVVDNVISGVGFLGPVAVLVEDAWAGVYSVVNGTITLEDVNISVTEPYNGPAVVGYQYTGTMKTFEVAQGNALGTGLGTSRRWSRLFIRLLDSALPIVNGTLPPDRTPETFMNIAETLRVGLQDVDIRGAGWGDGSIEVVQDRPYPTQVIGLFGEFKLNND
jgi:hypothetical protein